MRRIAFWIVLVVIIVITLFPLYWVISTSVKNLRDAFAMPPVWVFLPTFENYDKVLHSSTFIRGFGNSLVVSLVSSGIALALGSAAAYGIVQQDPQTRRSIERFVLTLRIAPAILFVIPAYYLSSRLGLLNSYIVLIAVYSFVNLPFAISLMLTFLEEIPRELREAGMVDGASEFTIFWRIFMPVARGGIVATFILCVLFTWNEFFIALVLSGRDTQTLPVTITSFLTYQGVEWGTLTAAAALIMVPMLVLGMLVQSSVVRGMTLGSVKG
ncbi:MAG: carbohydrate ABC transporter permease [Devosia sp.]|nr:carbohydrate ABC transporter permease [Devosia sp.]